VTALYPAFLKLEALPVVVVGGGTVAASKLDGLLAAGARVTVVAPHVRAEIRERVTVPITVIEEPFRAEHLADARWVVARGNTRGESRGRRRGNGAWPVRQCRR
jgi:siroheme synthase-like protein